MSRTMSGLVKPLTQRGRPTAAFRPTRAVNDGLFVSSYHEDKKRKYRQQMRARMVKWFLLGVLGVAAFFLKDKMESLVPKDAPSGLRSSSDTLGTTKQPLMTNHNPPKKDPPPPAKKAEELPFKRPNPFCSAAGGAKATVAKGDDDAICGRKIPVNLAKRDEWPTPYTSRKIDVPANNKEVVLLKKDAVFGGLGNMLNALFHAYDYAHDSKRPLYMTQDSWAVKTLLDLFFGPDQSVEKNDKLWAAMQETLALKVVESEEALKKSGKTVFEYKGPSHLFYHITSSFNAKQMRDHRNTILRKLFHYPAKLGVKNACSAVDGAVGNQKDKKYTVIHIAPPAQRTYRSRLEGNTGKDHKAASEMMPTYVKGILKKLDMMKHDIYPIHMQPDDIDVAVHSRLATDAELKGQLKDVEQSISGCLGSNIYLAVLADVYLGNPIDQMSLWVARMRLALGMKNTFIFTNKGSDQWDSFLDDDKHTYLYDRKKLGIPWMG